MNKLINEYVGKSGVKYIFEYSDADSFDHLEKDKCKQCYGVCFYDDKVVLGYSDGRKEWQIIGGTVEKGEDLGNALKREIQEESNMEVLNFLPIGYQKVTDTRDDSFVYQLRYVCSVRPYGPFVSDPAGDIIKIELIKPENYKEYFDWGQIGDRIMERSLELLSKL